MDGLLPKTVVRDGIVCRIWRPNRSVTIYHC